MTEQGWRNPVRSGRWYRLDQGGEGLGRVSAAARGLVPRRSVRSAAGDEPPPYGKSAVDELADRSEALR